MKRNHPPDHNASVTDIEDERKEVDKRLREFSSGGQVRKVPRVNKTTYCDSNHHVRIEPGLNMHQFEGFSQYSSELGYHYLGPLQALYLTESRQILIYLNELPLSLAEAYDLLLRNRQDFQNYTVFSHLNRNGFYCLRPNERSPDQSLPGPIAGLLGCPENEECSSGTKPIFEIDSCNLTYDDLMDKLRSHGPQDLVSGCTGSHRSSIPISFDVYKRETFARNKPKKEQPGTPDHFLVIRDRSSTFSPSCLDLLPFDDDELCKILFAIIDHDSALSFVQYNSMDLQCQLVFELNTPPEIINEARLVELRRASF